MMKTTATLCIVLLFVALTHQSPVEVPQSNERALSLLNKTDVLIENILTKVKPVYKMKEDLSRENLFDLMDPEKLYNNQQRNLYATEYIPLDADSWNKMNREYRMILMSIRDDMPALVLCSACHDYHHSLIVTPP
jgi:hypothetical protein